MSIRSTPYSKRRQANSRRVVASGMVDACATAKHAASSRSKLQRALTHGATGKLLCLALRSQDGTNPPRLVWRTEEAGKSIEYAREPARSLWQRLKVKLLSWLPLDSEL